jgi:hypothetical protein
LFFPKEQRYRDARQRLPARIHASICNCAQRFQTNDRRPFLVSPPHQYFRQLLLSSAVSSVTAYWLFDPNSKILAKTHDLEEIAPRCAERLK